LGNRHVSKQRRAIAATFLHETFLHVHYTSDIRLMNAICNQRRSGLLTVQISESFITAASIVFSPAVSPTESLLLAARMKTPATLRKGAAH
jgi:hypothetical protein